jgi:hypothetical protein
VDEYVYFCSLTFFQNWKHVKIYSLISKFSRSLRGYLTKYGMCSNKSFCPALGFHAYLLSVLSPKNTYMLTL